MNINPRIIVQKFGGYGIEASEKEYLHIIISY